MIKCMISRVECGKSFITSGPGVVKAPIFYNSHGGFLTYVKYQREAII